MNEETYPYDANHFLITGSYVLFKRKFPSLFYFLFFFECKRTVTLFHRAFQELSIKKCL